MRRQVLCASAGTVALLALAAPFSAATPAAHAVQLQDRSVDLPLHGTVTGCDANEPVDVHGTVHVLVRSQPTATGTNVDIHTHLTQTTGVGKNSHGTYRLTGADSQDQTHPPSPFQITFAPNFQMHAPNLATPPHQCKFVTEKVAVAANGSIDDITAKVATAPAPAPAPAAPTQFQPVVPGDPQQNNDPADSNDEATDEDSTAASHQDDEIDTTAAQQSASGRVTTIIAQVLQHISELEDRAIHP